MYPRISHLAAVLVGGAGIAASTAGMACSLAPTDPIRIQQMMAREIAHRLGMRPQQVPLHALSQPQLHSPFPLGADCSGLGALHHSAGFRWSEAGQPEPGPWPGPWPKPWPWPDPRKPWPGPGSAPEPRGAENLASEPEHPSLRRPQTQCTYEGVAVVLGYGYSSPVAVNFERRCR